MIFRIIFSLILSISFCSSFLAMELEQPSRQLLENKLETIRWIASQIKPINKGRFTYNQGAQSNCTRCAYMCLKVLSGMSKPTCVAAKKRNFDIMFRLNEDGRIICHEAKQPEITKLITLQQFTELIDLVNDTIEPTMQKDRDLLKYYNSTMSSIVDDIRNIPGSAESEGKDKTIVGLIHYYYKNSPEGTGHIANFFRDSSGNVFFVDAQNEYISENLPTKILEYELKDEIFFYPLPPKSGYYIKTEKNDIDKNRENIQEPINIKKRKHPDYEDDLTQKTFSKFLQKQPKRKKYAIKSITDKLDMNPAITYMSMYSECPICKDKSASYRKSDEILIFDENAAILHLNQCILNLLN